MSKFMNNKLKISFDQSGYSYESDEEIKICKKPIVWSWD